MVSGKRKERGFYRGLGTLLKVDGGDGITGARLWDNFSNYILNMHNLLRQL